MSGAKKVDDFNTGKTLNELARTYAHVVLEKFTKRDKFLGFESLYGEDIIVGPTAMVLDLLCGNVNPPIHFGSKIEPGNRVLIMNGTTSAEQAARLVEYVTRSNAIPVGLVSFPFSGAKEFEQKYEVPVHIVTL